MNGIWLLHRPKLILAPTDPTPPVGEFHSVDYSPTTVGDILNPERGFHAAESNPGGFAGVRNSRNLTVTRMLVRLDDFRGGPISQQWLNSHVGAFNSARTAGIKLDIRYCYNYTGGGADASLERILQHIEQLQPVWAANYDAISTLQAGFVGAWGEWHSSSSGHTSNSVQSRNGRIQILQALMDAVPEKRMITCRYPEMQAEWSGYTPSAYPNYPATVSALQAFTGVDISRFGILNDCFLRNETDTGTYVRDRYAANYSTNNASKQYWRNQSRYVAASGETCASDWVQGNRESGPAAIAEMVAYNWDLLNIEFNASVISGWRSSGHFDEISRRLGYRLRLVRTTVNQAVTRNTPATITLRMVNDGFGKVYNPRPLDLVLVHQNGSTQTVRLTLDARRNLPLGGETRDMTFTFQAPATTGTYNLFLRLPDEHNNIANDSRYAIRLVNANLWDANTGRHNLQISMTVGA